MAQTRLHESMIQLVQLLYIIDSTMSESRAHSSQAYESPLVSAAHVLSLALSLALPESLSPVSSSCTMLWFNER